MYSVKTLWLTFISTTNITWHSLYCLFVDNFRNFSSKKFCSHFFFLENKKIGKSEPRNIMKQSMYGTSTKPLKFLFKNIDSVKNIQVGLQKQ